MDLTRRVGIIRISNPQSPSDRALRVFALHRLYEPDLLAISEQRQQVGKGRKRPGASLILAGGKKLELRNN